MRESPSLRASTLPQAHMLTLWDRLREAVRPPARRRPGAQLLRSVHLEDVLGGRDVEVNVYAHHTSMRIDGEEAAWYPVPCQERRARIR